MPKKVNLSVNEATYQQCFNDLRFSYTPQHRTSSTPEKELKLINSISELKDFKQNELNRNGKILN